MANTSQQLMALAKLRAKERDLRAKAKRCGVDLRTSLRWRSFRARHPKASGILVNEPGA
jgi:hypothetical protein